MGGKGADTAVLLLPSVMTPARVSLLVAIVAACIRQEKKCWVRKWHLLGGPENLASM